MADEAEFDVVVVGSGAAGMTAALTAARNGLRAVVLEKTGYFGGSTARSSGSLSSITMSSASAVANDETYSDISSPGARTDLSMALAPGLAAQFISQLVP